MRIALFLLLLTVSCMTFGQTHFEIHGEVKGLDNEMLLLLKTVGESFEIDFIEVQDEKFTYVGEIAEPCWVQILTVANGTESETEDKLTEFILEASDIYIVGCSKDYDDVNVYGSKADKVLKAYFAEDEALNQKWRELEAQKLAFEEAQDTEHAQATKEKMNHVVLHDKVALLKKYVTSNNDNIIGALIPNFCTLGEILTPADYADIYNLLSPENQQTDFGKSILEMSKE